MSALYSDAALKPEMLVQFLDEADSASPQVMEFMERARQVRSENFQNRVQVHVINNVRNGNCQEDCGYCAQRKSAEASVPDYGLKSDEEILKEAERASQMGAYRYCLVMSGRGPGRNTIERLKRTIRLIKESYPVEVCLSAGILKDAVLAQELARAGLDRYNHNLNTSPRNYSSIASTHTYADRADTLNAMKQAGVSLCSGVIAGMGETSAELIELACKLRSLEVESIPVNFFIPVPGHALKDFKPLNTERCLRILAAFRLINPESEVRLAAGRELYLSDRLADAMQLANSLFVSGYLNVKGATSDATVFSLRQAGFLIELKNGNYQEGAQMEALVAEEQNLSMKTIIDLRPFA